MTAIGSFLHARINEQAADLADLKPKYHHLVDQHLGEHNCEDDYAERRYASGDRCPWISHFASMWKDHTGYQPDWSTPTEPSGS